MARISQDEINRLVAQLGDLTTAPSARHALVALGGPAVRPILEAIVHQRAEMVRFATKQTDFRTLDEVAYGVLMSIGEPAVELLLALLRDQQEAVAAVVLGNMRDPRAVEHLIPMLANRHRVNRMLAADALRKIGDARAIEPLIGRLRDRDGMVRFTAIQALGELGDRRAIEPLRRFLAEDPPGDPKAAGEPPAARAALVAIRKRIGPQPTTRPSRRAIRSPAANP